MKRFFNLKNNKINFKAYHSGAHMPFTRSQTQAHAAAYFNDLMSYLTDSVLAMCVCQQAKLF